MPLYVWTTLYLWTPLTYVWMPPVCFDDVWMPPVHTQHKESMLCQIKGVSICPHAFECPPYVWMPPECLDGPHIFGYPPYVWMSPVCLDDVWMPAVHIQYKESMLCQTKGVTICPPYIWMPPYVWMPPVCLDAPCMFGCLIF